MCVLKRWLRSDAESLAEVVTGSPTPSPGGTGAEDTQKATSEAGAAPTSGPADLEGIRGDRSRHSGTGAGYSRMPAEDAPGQRVHPHRPE